MVESTLPAYILRLSSGKTFKICQQDGTGLLLYVLNKSGQWLSPSLLAEDAEPGFSACVDAQDLIHVLYQDHNGNIGYLCYSNKKWENRIILNSRNRVVNKKYLHVECTNGTVYCFYVLEHKGSMLLSCQSIKGGDISTPSVIDYIGGKNVRYSLVHADEKLYIFYKYAFGTRNQLGFKMLNTTTGQMGEFTTVAGYSLEDENLFLGSAGGEPGTAHMCWQRAQMESFELVYSKINCEQKKWSSDKVVETGEKPFSNAGVLVLSDFVIIYWEEEDGVYCCISQNGGKTWEKRKKYSPHGECNLRYVYFHSRAPSDPDARLPVLIPADISHGLKLYFFDESFIESMAKKQPSGIESEDFAYNVTELEKRMDQLEKRVSMLEKLLGEINIKA